MGYAPKHARTTSLKTVKAGQRPASTVSTEMPEDLLDGIRQAEADEAADGAGSIHPLMGSIPLQRRPHQRS